ncbi:MAG TPA: glycosyltransferase family 39 protein [Patescibacteria group bacterium]|nr:glycosyltransferase family 39 protein [Patescibacteria group bacterium]
MAYRGTYLVPLILIALLVITRLLVLTATIDKLYIEDELYRGNVAKELLSGPVLPFFDYQRSEYEGGALVMGVLAVPFFLLLGATLFSLKLVVLSFSVGTVILWYFFLRRFFDQTIAVVTSLLWILAPPFCVRGWLYTMGAPCELSFFNILALLIFYQLFFHKKNSYLFALLGFISGFALFFAYYFAVMLAVMMLFWFIFDRKFVFSRNFFIFGLSSLCGFSPWICYNKTHSFEGFMVAEKPILYWFSRSDFVAPLSRLWTLFTKEIANSLDFQGSGFLGQYSAYIYYSIFLSSLCWLLFYNRKPILKIAGNLIFPRRFTLRPEEMPKETILFAYFFAFCLVFALSRFEFRSHYYAGNLNRYRYIVPIYPFVFAVIAIALQRIRLVCRSAFTFAFMVCVICALSVLCLVGNLRMVSFKNLSPGKSFMYTIYRGYNYYDLGKLICRRPSDPAVKVEVVKNIKQGDDRRYCYAGMGWGFAKDEFSADYDSYVRNVLPRFDRQYWPNAWERLGQVTGAQKALLRQVKNAPDQSCRIAFFRGCGIKEAEAGKLVKSPQEYAWQRESITAEYLPYFYEGMGTRLFETLTNEPEAFFRFSRSLEEGLRQRVYEGLAEGMEYFQYSYDRASSGITKIGYNVTAWNTVISAVEDRYKPYCYQRLGIEIGWKFIHDIQQYRAFLARSDEQYRCFLYKGLGIGIGWRFGYDLDACRRLIEATDQNYRPLVYEGLGVGAFRRNRDQFSGAAERFAGVPKEYWPSFSKGIQEER